MRPRTILAKAATMVLLAMLMPVAAWAETVTEEQARQQVQLFLTSHQTTGGPRRAPGITPQTTLAGQLSGLYMFNIGGDGGFVVVSNDDRTRPILGYSDSGSIDPANMPDNMRAWLQGYADEIAWLQSRDVQDVQIVQSVPRRTGSHSTTAIAPLMSTTWNQGTPYNNLCPEYETGRRAATGCVATAMAQVMYYTEKKAGNSTTVTTATIPDYTTYSYSIAMPAIEEGTTINWYSMTDSYDSGSTEAANQAVAELMLYCGCAVTMNYGPSSGSSTGKIVNALKNYFGYENTTQIAVRSYYTPDNWTDLIYNELNQGRPVILGGQSSGGGHEFVCDGYKYESETDFFHINWGWGGMSDNYFVLSALNPDQQGIGGSTSADGYNSEVDAVVGIQKLGGTGTVLDVASNVNLALNSIELSKGTIALGETVTVTINVTNNSNDAYNGELYLLVDGSLAQVKTFEIGANESQDCNFEYAPSASGTHTILCGIPSKSGGYSWGQYPSATLKVDDKTPYDLAVSSLTPTAATIGWTSEATTWNLRSRPLTITGADISDGMPTGWTGFVNGENY